MQFDRDTLRIVDGYRRERSSRAHGEEIFRPREQKGGGAETIGSADQRPNNPRKDLVLEQLLNKAAELFLYRGYANTRMQDIAESMQMSRSSLYHYFENKEEVLLALTEGDVQIATDALEALLAKPSISWADKLRGWIEGNIRKKLCGRRAFPAGGSHQNDLPAGIGEVFRKHTRKFIGTRRSRH